MGCLPPLTPPTAKAGDGGGGGDCARAAARACSGQRGGLRTCSSSRLQWSKGGSAHVQQLALVVVIVFDAVEDGGDEAEQAQDLPGRINCVIVYRIILHYIIIICIC